MFTSWLRRPSEADLLREQVSRLETRLRRAADRTDADAAWRDKSESYIHQLEHGERELQAALQRSAAEAAEARERAAALEASLATAEAQLSARTVAGSFALGGPSPDALAVAADDLAAAITAAGRALLAATDALVGGKAGRRVVWATAVGEQLLPACVENAASLRCD